MLLFHEGAMEAPLLFRKIDMGFGETKILGRMNSTLQGIADAVRMVE